MPGPLVSNPVTIFLVVLGIILVVPIVLQRLKIPYVIGLIVAGVAVGPYGFNILERDMSFEVFANVGILYLMFLAGLEIDMFHLKKNLSGGLLFGICTFLIPLAAGFAAGVGLLHLSGVAALLLASMFAAHTLLAYPIIARFGLSKTRPVVIAVAATIVTVLGALMVVAAVGGICRDGFSWVEMLRLLGVIAAFCAAMVYLYPRVSRWFFKRYSDRVAQFIYVLFMTFLAAAVARWIGIEGVFGAFLAGLVLNRYVPARSPLMSRLEFVGNALFIPYFLIGVGMLINVKVLTSGWATLYAAAIMSAVAMASKWLSAFVAQKWLGMSSTDRSVLYQLTNAHTAVALAVVTIGFDLHIFGETILNATVLMVLVTCTVSSIGTERAARRLRLKEVTGRSPEALTGHSGPVRSLICISNPLTAPGLVDLAILMGNGERPGDLDGRRLFALHVRSDNSPSSIAAGRNSLDIAEQAAAAAETTLTPIERFDLNFITGILNTIEERQVSEVMIGLHRRSGVIDTFFGSKIEQLLGSTNKAVFLSRCFIPLNTLTRIVVWAPRKAEFESGFQRWVLALTRLASQLGCRLIFHCFDDTARCVRGVIVRSGIDLRAEFCIQDSNDDYVLLAGQVLDDDLFVVVTARRTSLSYDTATDALPEFLQSYFSRNNLMVIYPEQVGTPSDMPTMAETLSADFSAMPSPLWLKLRGLFRPKVSNQNRP